jgi:eukaryotic-like serine/threonine-protein kinase
MQQDSDMGNIAPAPGGQARNCPHCQKPAGEDHLSRTQYRCPTCGLEVAYTDTALNGTVREVFGYLKPAGEIIHDRYRVEKVLGKGGYGATYLVEDLRIKGKRRALKEVPEALFDDQEVDLLGRLRHAAIPDIIDRFSYGGMVYLVLEFGGRRTLASHCQEVGGRLPLATALPWMRQLCEVLAHLHCQDPAIIHRDLKPENVLLDDDDHIMLIDFGIAKAAHATANTQSLARAVTHGFSPPEQVLGTGTDARSDIYSFGATFYYLLTGRVPAAAHERLAGRELQTPSTLVDGLSAELDRTLLACLSLNIDQRPGSARDLKSMIDNLVQSAIPDAAHAFRTTRLSLEAGSAPNPQPLASIHGIRLADAEPIPAKARAGLNGAKHSGLPLLFIILAALLAAFIAGAYLYLRGGTKLEGSGAEVEARASTRRPEIEGKIPTGGTELTKGTSTGKSDMDAGTLTGGDAPQRGVKDPRPDRSRVWPASPPEPPPSPRETVSPAR